MSARTVLNWESLVLRDSDVRSGSKHDRIPTSQRDLHKKMASFFDMRITGKTGLILRSSKCDRKETGLEMGLE